MDIKKYWKSYGELEQTPEYLQETAGEFSEELPLEEVLTENTLGLSANRRDFLKVFGFSLSAATLAACTKAPIRKAIPYVEMPEQMSPSIANYFASSYFDGHEYASVLVKTREGRPIKVDGNNLSSINKGAASARVQASVLSLYDTHRAKDPLKKGQVISWDELDQEVIAKLASARAIRLVSHSVISPTTQTAISNFLGKYPSAKHISYDTNSASGILEANQASFGKAMVPSYKFDAAKVIVGINCDFLGNWISPVEFTKDYSKTRRISADNPKLSYHIQFESMLSLTGSNADSRSVFKPTQEGLVVANLYNKVASLTGSAPVTAEAYEVAGKGIEAAARELVAARGNALVVCGSNDANVQLLVNGINQMLGSYGTTIDWSRPYLTRQGMDIALQGLIDEMKSGQVDILLLADVNPVYELPQGGAIKEAMAKVATVVCFNGKVDETAALATYHAPNHHYLESWGDAQPKMGYYSLTQPAITPIFNTRNWIESLVKFTNGNTVDSYDLLRATWGNLHRASGSVMGFEAFWRTTLHNGVLEIASGGSSSFSGNVAAAASGLMKASSGEELFLYEKLSIGTGNQANNPWLQELPDPLTRSTWDNYLTISKKYAIQQGLKDGDHVKVEANGYSVEVPVLILPGQMANVFGLAIGYGRTAAGKAADGVGVNAYPFATIVGGKRHLMAAGVKVSKTGGFTPLALTQTHHTIEGRDLVKETTFEEYLKNRTAGNIRPHIAVRQEDGSFKKQAPATIKIWEGHEYNGHKWAMAIDLNACTGCGACVVACQAENNVPVVGKDEVIRRREMHWIRIDRYFSYDNGYSVETKLEHNEETHKAEKHEHVVKTGITKEINYASIKDYENIDVVFQPVMCMQCNNAPCETVCPVLATTHSEEGLNQMTYNRCVGTRYCANNCPYKVRRFNWFDYIHNEKFYLNPSQSDLGKMVLNPDVTVRSRGVMEKCTFCVQRIQAGKLEAKRQGKRPEEGAIKTACQQTCPADAIVFGDVNDVNSEVHKLFKNERSYAMLEEVNVQPSVNYLVKIRNRKSVQA